jgi:hypothetical protein
MGEAKVKEPFPDDHTHTSPAGADSPLAAWLSAKGQAVQAIAAPRPPMQQPVPADAKLPSLFLIGDSTVRNGTGDGANGQWG